MSPFSIKHKSEQAVMTERTTNFNITNGDQGHGSHSSNHYSRKASAVLRTAPGRSGGPCVGGGEPGGGSFGFDGSARGCGVAVGVEEEERRQGRLARCRAAAAAPPTEACVGLGGPVISVVWDSVQRCSGYNWAESLGFVGLSYTAPFQITSYFNFLES